MRQLVGFKFIICLYAIRLAYMILGLAVVSLLLKNVLWVLISPLVTLIITTCSILIFGRNAIDVVKISEKGINNRHISFFWEEITNYKIHDLEIKWAQFPLKPIYICSVVVFGNAFSNDFWGQNLKMSVAIPINKKI